MYNRPLIEGGQRRGLALTDVSRLFYPIDKVYEGVSGVKVHIEYSRTDCDACLNNTMDFGIVAFPVRRAHLAAVEWLWPLDPAGNHRGQQGEERLLVTLDFAEGRFTRSVGIIDRRGSALPAAAREFVRLLMTTR